MQIRLISSRQEISPYLSAVRAAADTERTAFGFLPARAYDEFAYQGRMILAVDQEKQALAGYTLFGGTYPQGKIFQTWTASQYRGKSVGRQLIDEVVRRLENASFLSIRADVADDLQHANQFYGELGFDVVRSRPGKTAGRTINIRVRELATPSLLEMAADGTGTLTCVPAQMPAATIAPLYLIDLNVLFDVLKHRSRADSARRVFSAALENNVRLAISVELVHELERTTLNQQPDPILAFAMSLPQLPLPTPKRCKQVQADLAPVLFPDRARDNILKPQDHSDLRHLITAIDECAAGFVTSDRSVLMAAEHLRTHYGLQVLSPEAFGDPFETPAATTPPLRITSGAMTITAGQLVDGERTEVEAFLKRLHVPDKRLRAALSAGTASSPRRRFTLRCDGAVCAFASWSPPEAGTFERDLHLYVAEDVHSTTIAAEHLIRRAVADIGSHSPTVYHISTLGGQPTVRHTAIANGFSPAGGGSPRAQSLRKVALGRIVLPDNWASVATAILNRAGISIPPNPPAFTSMAQTVRIEGASGSSTDLPFATLERLLSPAIFALPERPAAVIPITRAYAEELFRGSAQPSFLSDREAVLRTVRAYISGRGTYSTIPEDGIVVFYESGTEGGRMAATAVARVVRRYLMEKDSAAQFSTAKGVLSDDTIMRIGRGKQVVVTEVDDIMLFQHPVSLAKLRSIGCADGANFVTARKLASQHLLAIVEAGKPHV